MLKLNAIKQMENFARYNPDVVSLSQGIPFMQSDELIREDVARVLFENKVDRYSDPQGILELRESISNLLFDECMCYSEKEIIISSGAIEALSATFLGIITPKRDEVIIPTPTYSAYFRLVKVARGKVVSIPLDEDNGWQLDLNLLEKKITNRTTAILICNPNNPTGSIYSKQTLVRLAAMSKKHNILLIVDEVYKNMIFDDAKLYNPCIDDSFRKNIVRVVSFSKDFSLTGWRVGFLHSDQEVIEQILPVHDTLVNCAPVISQYAALSAITHQDRIISKIQANYIRQREIMADYLNNLTEFLTYKKPQGSYYYFPKLRNHSKSSDFCMDLLKKQKVAVVPGVDFGFGGEGHVRICFGRGEEDIRTGMERFVKYFYNGSKYVNNVSK